MTKLNIKILTLDEAIFYGILGDVEIKSEEEWLCLEKMIEARVLESFGEGESVAIKGYEEQIDDSYHCGYEQGKDA